MKGPDVFVFLIWFCSVVGLFFVYESVCTRHGGQLPLAAIFFSAAFLFFWIGQNVDYEDQVRDRVEWLCAAVERDVHPDLVAAELAKLDDPREMILEYGSEDCAAAYGLDTVTVP